MSELRLAVFDVDGTLVDSQAEIVSAARVAFETENLSPPARGEILAIIGLSLDHAMARLAPQLSDTRRDRLVAAYRSAYFRQRQANGASPLYDGALDALERLAGDPFLLMGVATGKSKRGLDAVIEAHDLARFFVTRQVADFHPSKPHPAMLRAALGEAGIAPAQAVMIGDTRYDMDMARAAGTAAIGVDWGYHPVSELQADAVISEFAALPDAVDSVLSKHAEIR